MKGIKGLQAAEDLSFAGIVGSQDQGMLQPEIFVPANQQFFDIR
jgi:hypothetical protein